MNLPVKAEKQRRQPVDWESDPDVGSDPPGGAEPGRAEGAKLEVGGSAERVRESRSMEGLHVP